MCHWVPRGSYINDAGAAQVFWEEQCEEKGPVPGKMSRCAACGVENGATEAR